MGSAILAAVSRQRLTGIMDIAQNYPVAVFPTMEGSKLAEIKLEGSKLAEIKRESDYTPEASPIPVYLYETG